MNINDELKLEMINKEFIGYTGDTSSRLLIFGIYHNDILQRDEDAILKMIGKDPEGVPKEQAVYQSADGYFKITLDEFFYRKEGTVELQFSLLHKGQRKFLQTRFYEIKDTFFDDELRGTPIWVEKSKYEKIPRSTVTIERNDITAAESYTVQGSDGLIMVTWKEELVEGVPTGRITDKTERTVTPAVDNKYYLGIKPDNKVAVSIQFTENASTGEQTSNFTKKNFVTDYGGKGDGITDNNNMFQKLLNDSKTTPVECFIPKGTYFSKGTGNLELWPGSSKGLKLIGETGTVIMPQNNGVNQFEKYFMKLQMADDNEGLEIKNLVIDGSKNPQDMFWWMQDKGLSPADIPLQRGFKVEGAKNPIFDQLEFRHMYGGFCIHLLGYANPIIKNIKVDDVGGEDKTKSFGYFLHLDQHPGDAVVEIDNVQCVGKVGSRPLYDISRIAVVFENLSTQYSNPNSRVADRNTTINIRNSSFSKYEYVFWTETAAGNVYWNVDDCVCEAKCYSVTAGILGEFKHRANNLTMNLVNWTVPIGYGMGYSEREASDFMSGKSTIQIYNSKITDKKPSGTSAIPAMISYGNNTVVRLYNTTVENVGQNLCINAGAECTDCQINLAPGNSRTTETQLITKSESRQFLNLVRSPINTSGAWKQATKGQTPGPVYNTGYVAPPLTDVIGNLLEKP